MEAVCRKDNIDCPQQYYPQAPCSCYSSVIIRWCKVDDPLADRLAKVLHQWNDELSIFQDVAKKLGTIRIASTSTGTASAESWIQNRTIKFNPDHCKQIQGPSFDIQRAAAAVLFEFGLMKQDRRGVELEREAASGRMQVQEFVYLYEQFEYEVHLEHVERLGSLSSKGLFRMETLPSLCGKVSFPHHILYQELTAHTKYPEEMFRVNSPDTTKSPPLASFWPKSMGSSDKSILEREIPEYCHCIKYDQKALDRLFLKIKNYARDYGPDSNLVVNLNFMARSSRDISRDWNARFVWMSESRQSTLDFQPPYPETDQLLKLGSFPL